MKTKNEKKALSSLPKSKKSKIFVCKKSVYLYSILHVTLLLAKKFLEYFFH